MTDAYSLLGSDLAIPVPGVLAHAPHSPPQRLPSPPPSRSPSPDSDAVLPFTDLAPATPPATPSETSIPLGPVSVRLHTDAGPGCGGVAWRCGEVMARYLAHRAQDPAYLGGRTVLEIGSGTGLVGIAAAMLAPSADVWATDLGILLDLMRANAELNLPKGRLRVAELSWGEPLPESIPEVDVLLAADCVYHEPTYPLLLQTLCDLAPPSRPVEILFAWKKRRKANKRFFAMLRKHFDWQAVDDDAPGAREEYAREGITLLRLARRN